MRKRVRNPAVIAAALAVAAALIGLVVTTARRPAPQYVFLICHDAVRPDHLGCYGYPLGTTPRIDDLARQGFVFEDAVSQAPWTTPSVATLLSSTFPCQHGARRTGGARTPYADLPGNFIETLGALGYQTALFTGGIAVKNKVPASDLVESALRWLGDNLESKCFIVIHNYETHSPYVGTPACVEALDPGYTGPFKLRFGDLEVLRQARVGRLQETLKLTDADVRHIKALYDCQIERSDRAVGTLVDSLRSWKCLDKSLIVVFADHGEEFIEHGSIDHGQTVHEETLRIPLVVFCPAVGTSGRRIAEQVGLIDLAPTLFDILGIAKPAYFEGVTLLPLMSPRAKMERAQVRPCGLPTQCLVAESIARRSERKALRCPPWKLIFDPFFGSAELYDIRSDPGEKTDLADQDPETATRLTETLLVMEKYYPGGWWLAWRGATPQAVRGKVTVESGLLEAVAHDFFPEIDPETDSLVVSEDWSQVRFAASAGGRWRGLEIRMSEPAGATVQVGPAARPGVPAPRLSAAVGPSLEQVLLPASLLPERARVDRRDLRALFRRAEADARDLVIFWVEPGSEPVARAQKETELRQQLKAVGYLE